MMSKQILKLLRRLPDNPAYRRFVAWVLIGLGIGYHSIIILDTPLTTSYARQAEIMPIAAWSVLFAVLGVGLLFTEPERRRRSWLGRGMAVLVMGVMAWQITTYLDSGGLTAIGWLFPCFVAMVAETFHISGAAT